MAAILGFIPCDELFGGELLFMYLERVWQEVAFLNALFSKVRSVFVGRKPGAIYNSKKSWTKDND